MALAMSPSVAFAAPLTPDVIPEKTGFIEARGGVRITPHGSMQKALEGNGLGVQPRLVTPAVLIPLGYRVDRTWAAAIEFSYGNGHFALTDLKTGLGSTLRSTTLGLQIVGQWSPNLGWERLEPFLSFGGGYYFSTLASDAGQLSEALGETNTTGFFAGVGLRWAATKPLGVVMESRYALAVAGVGKVATINVGGSTTSLGLYYVWK